MTGMEFWEFFIFLNDEENKSEEFFSLQGRRGGVFEGDLKTYTGDNRAKKCRPMTDIPRI